VDQAEDFTELNWKMKLRDAILSCVIPQKSSLFLPIGFLTRQKKFFAVIKSIAPQKGRDTLKNRIRGVIFDLDGTLVNSIGDLQQSVNTVMKAHGFPSASEEQMKQMVGNGIRKLIERALPEDCRTQPMIDDCLREFSENYNRHCMDRTRPYQGMAELVEALQHRGVHTAVVSNKADPMAKQIVRGLLPDAGFEEIFGMREGIRPKPDPGALLQICSSWGILPEECVMVGDSNVDIQTGKNGGMMTVGAAWGFRGREELAQSGADQIAAEPAELSEMLLRSIDEL